MGCNQEPGRFEAMASLARRRQETSVLKQGEQVSPLPTSRRPGTERTKTKTKDSPGTSRTVDLVRYDRQKAGAVQLGLKGRRISILQFDIRVL
eukprot:SAG22_NODE_5472_length_1007_cov_4.666300_1_plen_93_part_01